MSKKEPSQMTIDQIEGEAMERVELEDEKQVLAELAGIDLGVFIYQFQDSSGRTITGLSLAGVRETVRAMNKRKISRISIQENPPTIEETLKDITVVISAEDAINGGRWWGVKRENKKTPKGKTKTFAMEIAVSKAQRNAYRGLIPENFVAEMIDRYIKTKGAAKKIGPEAPPPAKRTAAHPKQPGAKPVGDVFGIIRAIAEVLQIDYVKYRDYVISVNVGEIKADEMNAEQRAHLTNQMGTLLSWLKAQSVPDIVKFKKGIEKRLAEMTG